MLTCHYKLLELVLQLPIKDTTKDILSRLPYEDQENLVTGHSDN